MLELVYGTEPSDVRVVNSGGHCTPQEEEGVMEVTLGQPFQDYATEEAHDMSQEEPGMEIAATTRTPGLTSPVSPSSGAASADEIIELSSDGSDKSQSSTRSAQSAVIVVSETLHQVSRCP